MTKVPMRAIRTKEMYNPALPRILSIISRQWKGEHESGSNDILCPGETSTNSGIEKATNNCKEGKEHKEMAKLSNAN